METHETGRNLLKVPATLNQNNPHDPKKIRLLVSTERLSDLVLLRIDEMKTKDAA
jgi:hypothetical protein